jgi:hypothetical protein
MIKLKTFAIIDSNAQNLQVAKNKFNINHFLSKNVGFN